MSKSKSVVMFDVDGVLADFLGGFTKLAQSFDPSVPLLTYGEADPANGIYQNERWDFDPKLFPPKLVDKVWQEIKKDSSRFWAELEPLAGMGVFDWLAETNLDVYFVTSRLGARAKPHTEYWLGRMGVFRPTVIISSLKGECAKSLGASYSIEDKAGNAVMIKYWSPKTHSYILDWPYNRWDQDILGQQVRRVASVEEFLADVEEGK